MRLPHCCLLLLVALAPLPKLGLAEDQPTLERQGPTILFLGDSITAGGGYIDYVETWYLLHEKTLPTFLNLGLASETVSGLSEAHHPFPRPDLHTRLDRIFKTVKPDIVVACYGINDGIYHPFSEERFQAFQEGVEKLHEKTEAAGAKLVLFTPPPYAGQVTDAQEPADGKDFGYKTPFKDYDQVLEQYAKWVKSLDAKTEIQVVDARTPISQYMKLCYGKDPIHPNRLGHELMAEALLARLGKQTGHDTLTTGQSAVNQDVRWQQVEQLVHLRREAYDKALLEQIGHNRPGVKPKYTLQQGTEEAAKLDKQLAELLHSGK